MFLKLRNFLLLLTVAQTQQPSSASTTSKRTLSFNLEDAVFGPPSPYRSLSYAPHQPRIESKKTLSFSLEDAPVGPPPPYHSLSYGPHRPRTILIPASGKWNTDFDYDDAHDDAGSDSIYNDLNGFNYGFPIRGPPPPTTAIPSLFNGFSYGVNYGTSQDLDSTYLSIDGRIIKQYAVNENHQNDHPDPREFSPAATVSTQSTATLFLPSPTGGSPQHGFVLPFRFPTAQRIPQPILVASDIPSQFPSPRNVHALFSNAPSQFRTEPAQFPNLPAQFPILFTPNVAQPRWFFNNPQPGNPNGIRSFLNKHHGPIALGSGSLGFITRPNGDIFLGSGSIGYISHKDHYDNIIDMASRRQRAHPRGPLTFGHSSSQL